MLDLRVSDRGGISMSHKWQLHARDTWYTNWQVVYLNDKHLSLQPQPLLQKWEDPG